MTEGPIGPEDFQHVTQDFIFGDLSSNESLVQDLTAAGTGLRHRSRTVPAVPRADEPVVIECAVGADVSVHTAEVIYTTDGSLPDSSSTAVPMRLHATDWLELNWTYGECWRGQIPPQPEGTLVRYRIRATTIQGDTIWADPNAHSGEAGLFAYWLGDSDPPAWLREAVIYQIFVDRFATTGGASLRDGESLADFFGGTIDGVRERLAYLRELGVTCLWLSPLFPSPTHHGYDATDYVSVEPRLGTQQQLQALIEEAHALGMRVLLDFVANHCSDQHPSFRQALADPESCERAMFSFSGDTYQSFFDVGTMPKFALDRAPAMAYVLDAAGYWVRLGVDGYRLDYAMGPSHAFWAAFRSAVRTINPEAALIGEVTGSAAQLATYEGRLDGALDFLLLQALRGFVAFDLIDSDAFGRFLERHFRYFSARLVLPSFLDNHDMNRFLWAVRGDVRRLKLAALLQFMLPGPPIIYYGTEVGVTQIRDLQHPDGSRKLEESRTPMVWGPDQNADLLDFYRLLIRQRKLIRQRLNAVPVVVALEDPEVLVLGVGPGMYVAVNRSRVYKSVSLPSEALTIALSTDEGIDFDASMANLPPLSGCLLVHR
ncbi:MAG TPA: alpha-amylase family glycosyl hydrolase [Thermomicrobiales bacterium]|nr:alpha-amylase family glycosyl hydrolase [Thermomicrobiales bacterium]